MNEQSNKSVDQPNPFTVGVTKGMVREHALKLYHDKLVHDGTLSLEDWVLAEKDLVRTMEEEAS